MRLFPAATIVDIDYPEALALPFLNLRLNAPGRRVVVHREALEEISPGTVHLVGAPVASRGGQTRHSCIAT